MPLLLAAAAAAIMIQPECSWNRPGADPYRGTAAAAIERYRDIPRTDRDAIAARIAAGTPDDEVRIGRQSITGTMRYRDDIGDMHFGGRDGPPRLCRTVSRGGWRPDHVELADVYCSGDHCVVIPRVCGNVSRIERVRPKVPVIVEVAIPPAPVPVPDPQPLDPLTGIELGLADAPEPLPPEQEGSVPVPRDFGPGVPPVVWQNETPPLAPVPEPSVWALLVAGLTCLAFRFGKKPLTHAKINGGGR